MIQVYTSQTAEKIIKEYQKELGIKSKHHLLRIAISYSLFKEQRYKEGQDYKKETKEGEYSEEIIFQKHKKNYNSLLNLYYKEKLKEEKFKKYLTYHIEQGLRSLKEDYREEKHERSTVNNLVSFLYQKINPEKTEESSSEK